MHVTVKLFGPQARMAGKREAHIALPDEPTTIAQVRGALCAAEPCLADGLDESRFAVNHEFADEQQPVRAGDEVALIGMVSGG